MDREIVYLKINPDTYQLDASQFYFVTKCQFCGHDEFTWRRLFSGSTGQYRNLSWIQRCSDCNQTVATFPKKNKTIVKYEKSS